MTPKDSSSACLILLVCLLAVTIQILISSPICPNPLELPPPSSASLFPINNYLQRVIRLGEGLLEGPEDVCVDSKGVLYTATRDGWIRKMHRNGSWENWKMLNSNTLLGITITKADDLIVCDAEQGLIKVNEDSVTILTSQAAGTKIWFADDVVEGPDGSLYFSVASTKFGLHNWYLDVLEAKPYGQLLKYDPRTNETSILLTDLAFANGVAISKDQDYLVVCETWKFRCIKYWLKGEKKGKTGILVENLPGAPDNVNVAPDGSFWIAVLQMSHKGMEFVHRYKVVKQLVAVFPRLMKWLNAADGSAMVVKVGEDGRIIDKFDDAQGKVMSLVTTALEFEGHLYLGTLKNNFIGKLPLHTKDHI